MKFNREEHSMKKLLGAAMMAVLLAGCATEISGSASPISSTGLIARDLQAAAFNLTEAQRVGALPADDPAGKCLTGVLADLGLDGSAETESFTPKRDGIVSEGAVIYIRAMQVKAMRGYQLPAECDAVVGRFVIDAAKLGIKGLPGVR
jgi:hypothetical protein